MHIAAPAAAAVFSAALAAGFAWANWLLDPVGVLHKPRHPVMNTRRGKLMLLRAQARRGPVNALLLGSSRIFNMSPAVDGLPQPGFNLSVSSAMAEDYLALWQLARRRLAAPPQFVVVVCEPLAFHPRRQPDWECFGVADYRHELAELSALPCGTLWQACQLFSLGLLRQGLLQARREHQARTGKVRHRFHWYENGRGEWLVGADHASPRKLRRQIRTNPLLRSGLQSMQQIGQRRIAWFKQLLTELTDAGCAVIVVVPPEHPELKIALEYHGRMALYHALSHRLERMCLAQGAAYYDWHDPAPLGLIAEDFRDTIHFTEEGMRKLESALGRVIADAGSGPGVGSGA